MNIENYIYIFVKSLCDNKDKSSLPVWEQYTEECLTEFRNASQWAFEAQYKFKPLKQIEYLLWDYCCLWDSCAMSIEYEINNPVYMWEE